MKAVFGMGLAEARAVINLLSFPQTVVDMYAASAAKFGMTRGPITHAALGCKMLLVGEGPTYPHAGFTVWTSGEGHQGRRQGPSWPNIEAILAGWANTA